MGNHKIDYVFSSKHYQSEDKNSIQIQNNKNSKDLREFDEINNCLNKICELEKSNQNILNLLKIEQNGCIY